MKITLTDPDGIKFEIESFLINKVNSGSPTEILLDTGEKLYCKEDITVVMKKAVMHYFGEEC